jgi:hypothetical protein
MAAFNSEKDKLNLRYMGFCGADDSTQPELMQLLSTHFPWIEWGVLFRPDKEGEARYATQDWVERLVAYNEDTGQMMRLAAHLCEARCQEVLHGDATFVKQLLTWGFARVQINATAANGVEVLAGKHAWYTANVLKVVQEVPGIEFILQTNEETKPIYDPIATSKTPPSNISLLFDASCGKGVQIRSFPAPPQDPVIRCGYAGGIGPSTIREVLEGIQKGQQEQAQKQNRPADPVWIDMESSLRLLQRTSKDGPESDVFSIERCFQCILAAREFGMPVSNFSFLSI